MDDDGNSGSGIAEDPWALLVTRMTAFAITMIDDELRFVWPGGEDGELGMTMTVDHDGGRMVIESPWATDTIQFPRRPAGARVSAIHEQMAETVREWREFCPLPHPALARVAADGPAGVGVGVLRLGAIPPYGVEVITTCEGMADIPDPETEVRWFDGRAELVDALLEDLRCRRGEPELELDEDGDVPLYSPAGRYYVRVLRDRPVIHVFARVLDDVRSRKRTDAELNVLNRARHWSRWSRRERSVYQELRVYARPFVPATVDRMLQVFESDHQTVSGDLVDRLGGHRVG